MNRVVITGVGIVSSLGQDFKTFTRNLMAGQCAIGPLTGLDTSELTVPVAQPKRWAASACDRPPKWQSTTARR